MSVSVFRSPPRTKSFHSPTHVAELLPVPTGTRLGDLPSLFESLPRLSDEEARAFGNDLERMRTERGPAGGGDPWVS